MSGKTHTYLSHVAKIAKKIIQKVSLCENNEKKTQKKHKK